ncbi:MAG: ABC transporter substrate-binding protein [Alphaproteobacteria bacterium]|nr:ABC transporter substrate-binding protein [Alphaproteobacteria bacterium]
MIFRFTRFLSFFYLLLLFIIQAVPSYARVAEKSITLGMVLEPPHLDPTAGAAGAIDEVVYGNIFQGLTRIDGYGYVKPQLAERWFVSDDLKEYTFYLHKGVTFHDGTAFDAEDVVFSFTRAMAADSVNAQKNIFEPIDKIEVLDQWTIKIRLKRPTADFLYNLGWGDAVIVAKESYDSNKIKPIGTGPYEFVRWDKGNQLELKMYDGYWAQKPWFQVVRFKFIADPTAAMVAMESGEIDAFPNFPAPELLTRFQKNPRFKVVYGTTEGETILAINNARQPLNRLMLRQAICRAIDRQAVIDGAMFGYAVPIGSHFAPHNPDYIDLVSVNSYNLALAKELLQQAGYKGGDVKLTLKLPPPPYARRSGEIIAAQLARIGIQVQLIPVEWPQWLDEVFRRKDFDLTIVAHTEPSDINIYARQDYYFGYNNPEFRSIIEEISKTMDETVRRTLNQKAQKILADDSVNCFLFQLGKYGVWKEELKGMWNNSPIQANDMSEVYSIAR